LGGVIGLDLSSFNFLDRATSSVSGQQLITISCAPGVPEFEQIASLKALEEKKCRHIDLEEKAQESQQGREVREVYRPDPNVDIRKNIYATIWNKIQERPWLGYGIGSTGAILGQDEHGSDLNASNLFLEAWFSLGIGGLIIVAGIWIGAVITSLRKIFGKNTTTAASAEGLLLLLVTVALLIPNLFNAGLLLGILWVFWAWIGGLASEKTIDLL
jgi:ABC-type dipeptide/oligopeptide/nickel transport system permease subunit